MKYTTHVRVFFFFFAVVCVCVFFILFPGTSTRLYTRETPGFVFFFTLWLSWTCSWSSAQVVVTHIGYFVFGRAFNEYPWKGMSRIHPLNIKALRGFRYSGSGHIECILAKTPVITGTPQPCVFFFFLNIYIRKTSQLWDRGGVLRNSYLPTFFFAVCVCVFFFYWGSIFCCCFTNRAHGCNSQQSARQFFSSLHTSVPSSIFLFVCLYHVRGSPSG